MKKNEKYANKSQKNEIFSDGTSLDLINLDIEEGQSTSLIKKQVDLSDDNDNDYEDINLNLKSSLSVVAVHLYLQL